MRVLIVEDDARIARPVADDLRRQHHVVDVAGDGLRGLEFARSGVYDVILLDIMLPGADGVEIARRLRAEGSESLILMLTARAGLDEKVAALDAGADDYLVKPFALEELSARIRALSRRGFASRKPVLEHGRLRLDTTAKRAFFGDVPLSLTPTEYALVELLLRNPRQVFSKTRLLEKVASFHASSAEDSVKAHITNLRRKLRKAGANADVIATAYGYGYQLADQA